MTPPTQDDTETSRRPSLLRHEAVPYVVPMAGLLLLLGIGDKLGFGLWEYPLRVALLGLLLWFFSRGRFDLHPRHWVSSLCVGVAVFVIWIAPEVIWPAYRQSWIFNNALTGQAISSIPEAWRTIPLVLVVGSSRVDLQACKLEYSIVSPK